MPSHLNRVDLTDKNLFLELHKFNLIDRLKNDGILGKTFTIDQMTKKIRPIIPLGVDANTPWVHPKQAPNRICTKWQMIERDGLMGRRWSRCRGGRKGQAARRAGEAEPG